MRFSLFSCFYFFGSVYLLYIVHTQRFIFITISKLLLLHLLRCSTRSCSWLVFTNAAGIVQQRVRPSPFRTAPPGLKEWIFSFFFFLETRPRLGLLLRAKVQGTAEPLHYHEALSVPYTSSPGNCSEEFDVGKEPQLIQCVGSAPGQDRSHLISMIWDQSISYLCCIYIIYSQGRPEAPHWLFGMF